MRVLEVFGADGVVELLRFLQELLQIYRVVDSKWEAVFCHIRLQKLPQGLREELFSFSNLNINRHIP